jgi:hypothetical protein
MAPVAVIHCSEKRQQGLAGECVVRHGADAPGAESVSDLNLIVPPRNHTEAIGRWMPVDFEPIISTLHS